MKISLDLSPAQERHLIQIGLAALTERATTNGTAKPKSERKQWSAGQKRKFIATMAKKYRERKAEKNAHTAKRLNGHALSAPTTRAKRADGKPLRDPRKQWTPEHRANFIAAMKKKGNTLRKTAPAPKT